MVLKRKPLKSLRGCRRGASAVEFALITPVLLVGIMSLVDLGVAIFRKMEVTSAVRSGAQYALIDKDDTAGIATAVTDSTNLGSGSMTVTTTETCDCIATDGTITTLASCSSSCASGTKRYFMTVTATHAYSPIFLPSSLNVSGSVKIQTQ